MTVLIKVNDLSPALKLACVERGRALDERVSALDAVKEWSGWHLGDASWADSIISFYLNPTDTE